MKPRFRILLAEDNLADTLLVLEALRRRSIDCDLEHYLTASDAIQAIEKAGSSDHPAPDLVLLDYNLPGGNGLDILAAAGHNPRLALVPKAIISSFLKPEELQEAARFGANRVISKPANLGDFLTQVGDHVEQLLGRD